MSELTGRWCLKRSRGRMAVRVEVRQVHWSDNPGQYIYYWRWASEEDLLELVDLPSKTPEVLP